MTSLSARAGGDQLRTDPALVFHFFPPFSPSEPAPQQWLEEPMDLEVFGQSVDDWILPGAAEWSRRSSCDSPPASTTPLYPASPNQLHLDPVISVTIFLADFFAASEVNDLSLSLCVCRRNR